MFEGRLTGIFLTATPGAPLDSLNQAEVVEDFGIQGDRHAKQGAEKAGREVTLIESEAIAAIDQEYGVKLTPAETRRNLLTEDVPLNHLVGRTFRIGDVVLHGKRLCEPCGHLEELTGRPVLKALRHRGGLRADVVQGGAIRVGDSIQPASE